MDDEDNIVNDNGDTHKQHFDLHAAVGIEETAVGP